MWNVKHGESVGQQAKESGDTSKDSHAGQGTHRSIIDMSKASDEPSYKTIILTALITKSFKSF